MTVAVCLKCGAFKRGAFTLCSKCGYRPDNDESLTKHLLSSDHICSPEQLETIAVRIKAGEEIEFPAENLQAFWVRKAELDAQAKKLRRTCAIGCVGLLVIVAAAALIVRAM